MMTRNFDSKTVESFGQEWARFDQTTLSDDEGARHFKQYFSNFPWHLLPPGGGVGADVGCGSGRWAKFVAPRAERLCLVDASSEALEVAKRNLASFHNIEFYKADVGEIPFAPASLDFAYSLGVLHHVPDTEAGIRTIASTLKPGAPLLLYLYYAFDNRPAWYRALWRASDAIRRVISRLPARAKFAVAEVVAALIYWPLARTGRFLDKLGCLPESWPLAFYRSCPFYLMRTDALDRFGTPLEKRFTRAQIEGMLLRAGLGQVRFSETPPFWCAVGIKAKAVEPVATLS